MTSPPIAGATTVTAPSGFNFRRERRAEFFDDGHLLERERALKKLAAVQPAAKDKMAFEQRAAVAENLQDFVLCHVQRLSRMLKVQSQIHFGIFNFNFAATCATSLSPRPDRLTMMSSSLPIFGARSMHGGDGVGGFQRGNDAFQPRQFHEGVQRFRHRWRSCIRRGFCRATRRAPARRPRNPVRRETLWVD